MKRKTYFIGSDSMELSRSILLEETGVPRFIRFVVITMLLVIVAFVAWASVTQIDEVAVSYGKVIPSAEVRRVEAEDGGIVLQIPIVEGMLVEEGDLLVVLDPKDIISRYQQNKALATSLELRKERLTASVEARRPDFGQLADEQPEMATQQMMLYEQSLEAAGVRRNILKNQINQLQIELEELETRRDTLEQVFGTVKEEYESYLELFERGIVGKIEFNSTKRLYLQVQQDLMEVPTRRIQLLEQLTQSKNQLLRLDAELREGWIEEVAEINEQLAQVREVLERSRIDVDQLEVRAPVSGYVHNLRVKTRGEGVQAGEVLLELVPQDRQLIAETSINPRDRGHVELGQPVTVKVTAFDFSRYGSANGVLDYISPTTFTNDDGQPFYKAHIRLLEERVGGAATENEIRPGMTVQADINTGKKTLIEYLLKPIYVSGATAFQER